MEFVSWISNPGPSHHLTELHTQDKNNSLRNTSLMQITWVNRLSYTAQLF